MDAPSGCEVTPFDGDPWPTFEPAADPAAGPLALRHRSTLEIDAQAEIVRAAYPVLHRVLEAAIVESDDGDHEDTPIAPET
ncbi:MAG: hypothetical protein KBG48_16395 [Kofleriaceae bacterium]|nr:hypothetical protein [Kofleriaceae bacterium]MBP9168980.1 hypothetical protein [Kofleriaceae bacterium]MBP9858833.1 hypothetical protein [Kofleriaceae bacterium]